MRNLNVFITFIIIETLAKDTTEDPSSVLQVLEGNKTGESTSIGNETSMWKIGEISI